MSYIYFAFLFLMNSAFALEIFPGGHDGGGGKIVVCYKSEDMTSIRSVELLDFYEGRNLEGFTIPNYSGDYKDIYNQVIQKSASGPILNHMIKGLEIAKGFKFLTPGMRLNSIDDSNEIFIPKDCKIEQVANFQGESRVFVVSDFWNLMSDTDKAGLLMHEYLWMLERNAGAKNSSRARRDVARFFAQDYEFEKVEGVVKKGDYSCYSNKEIRTDSEFVGTSFIMSKIEGTMDCSLTFNYLNGLKVFSKTTATFKACEPYNFTTIYTGSSDENEPSIKHSFRNKQISIYSQGTKVSSLLWTLMHDNQSKKMNIKVLDLEFPGFDQPEKPLNCYRIKKDGTPTDF